MIFFIPCTIPLIRYQPGEVNTIAFVDSLYRLRIPISRVERNVKLKLRWCGKVSFATLFLSFGRYIKGFDERKVLPIHFLF